MIFQKAIFIISLLIVGCEEAGSGTGGSNDFNVTEITEWICTTDYNFGKYELDDLLACNDCPGIVPQPEGTDPIIYSSIEGCEAVCPDDSIQVTTVASPDGTGEYFTMYCTGYE